jgi:type I restriction enzyme R subunit
MATNTKEAGFEEHIVRVLVEQGGFVQGLSTDFDRENAVDLDKLLAFLQATQPDTVANMGIATSPSARKNFLFRLKNEITNRGVLDVLVHGVKDGAHDVELFYGTPSKLNKKAVENFEANIFSITRQVKYSLDDTRHAVDLVIFVNGLPLATFELKNNLTHQTYNDAIRQYQDTRDPKELLFMPGRAAVHLAMDEQQAYFCSELKGKASWFLPFNKGHDDGAGNPPNPNGYRTEYVWGEVFQKPSLVDIIENYARKVSEKDLRTGKKKTKYIWPRYHQLQAVRALLADAGAKGAGHRYLIQHSAGSGKSYSITWLAHQLISLPLSEEDDTPLFNTVIVITDRRVLDAQIRNEIKRFTQVKSIVGAVTEGSKQLREFLEQGKRIITSTIQKFPFILDELGDMHRDKRFALVIDEAHSSQGGKSAAAVNRALENYEANSAEEEEDAEDKLLRIMEGRKMLGNASYFAFTATPKNKTEELFGSKQPDGSFRPFHSYTMKQAIQEGFIKDVLANYTTVQSYYRLIKTVEDDPEFDVKKAQTKLRRYVESHEKPLREKADLMLDHFVREVWRPRLVGGEARAMVVTDGVNRVLEYKAIFDELIAEQQLPFEVIAGFSGEREWRGVKVTEATINGFPSNDIPDKLREDPYRILIVADKFQTGFDEPLLQTMYVDKALSDVKAVQTLSRLNRAHPDKGEVYVMDFANDADAIKESFARYYRTTILSEATDVNKLHDLKRDLDEPQVYSEEKIDTVVEMFLEGSDRVNFEGILDGCVEIYSEDLDEEEQVAFKGNAKAFVRLYNFLSALVDFTNEDWEKLSIFLNFLIPKLPTPKDEDMSRGLLETIDLDSYRNEIKARKSISLEDEEGTLNPIPVSSPGQPKQAELDFLSNIVDTFNSLFGAGAFAVEDEEHLKDVLLNALPEQVANDKGVQNAIKQGDRKKIAMEQKRATQEAILNVTFAAAARTNDMTTFLKAFSDSEQHQRFILETVRKMLKHRIYDAAVMEHPGWDELIELLEDESRIAFASGLKERGVPAPMDIDYDIKGTDGARALMVWTFEDHSREPLGLVTGEVSGEPRDILLVQIGEDPDPEVVAPQIIALLE